MRVAVVHNAVRENASLAERDVVVQVEAVSESLARLGHEPVAVPVTLDLESLLSRLRSPCPDAVFNLVESLGNSDRLAFLVPAVLEASGIAYTGSSAEAILVTGDKPKAKVRLVDAGLPTPDWVTANTGEEVLLKRGRWRSRLSGKFIVKAIWEHASLGMDVASIVTATASGSGLAALAERIRRADTPSFAEAFVEGREFNLAVLASDDGPQVLPPAEIDFSAFTEGVPRIVGYRAKWNEESFEYNHTPRRFDFSRADEPLLRDLRNLAKSCWTLFGLGGYARVDFRVDSGGQPWILEINANPCLSPDAGFAAAVEQASIGFDTAVDRILRAAGKRSGRHSSLAG